MKSTKAVLPFSKHGVIRAITVSPFEKRVPDFGARRDQPCTLAVDVGSLPEVRVGDAAVLWGPELPVEQIAAHAGTIPYELLCSVSQRVPLALVQA